MQRYFADLWIEHLKKSYIFCSNAEKVDDMTYIKGIDVF